MCRYDVIHKTGSTQHITTPPDEDRATAIGSMHKNFRVVFVTCSSEDMIADTQTLRQRPLQLDRQTDKHARHNTPLPYRGNNDNVHTMPGSACPGAATVNVVSSIATDAPTRAYLREVRPALDNTATFTSTHNLL